MNIQDYNIDKSEVDVNFNKVLGLGTFSTLYEAKWRGLKVAVKYFNQDCPEQFKIHLKKEILILIKLHHPNILQILGVVDEPFMIILELMGKSLHEYIVSNKKKWIPTCFIKNTKINYIKQLCLSIAYIHGRKPERIIHRDLKPSNILIKRDILKLSDFGISKIIPYLSNNDLASLKFTKNVGTFLYMAPEIMNEDKFTQYTVKSDIWSLGLIIYEIFENRKWAYDGDFESIDEFRDMITTQGVTSYLYFTSNTPIFCKKIILNCLLKDPLKRPSALQILEQF
jgi:serine/threonine protein kinase